MKEDELRCHVRPIGYAEKQRDERIRALGDLALIDAVLALEITDVWRAIVQDMRNGIVVEGRRGLSRKQRTSLEENIRAEMPILASEVPRGREVETPTVLRNLPKKPPQRRPVDE